MKNPMFDEGGFDRLPTAFRGILFTLSVYNQDIRSTVLEFQRFLGAEETGVIDPETCKKAEDMVQLKSGQVALEELTEALAIGQVNGVRYRVSQFKTPKFGFSGKTKNIEKQSFERDTYGEIKYGTD